VANFRTKEPIPTIHSAHVTSSNRHVVTKSNAKQEKLLHSLNLCSESDRLKTFTNDWVGLCAPLAKEMAASGWFYLGTLDRTQCFSCGGVLRNWRRLDNPGREHIIHFPHCAMAQGRESRNISADILKQVGVLVTWCLFFKEYSVHSFVHLFSYQLFLKGASFGQQI